MRCDLAPCEASDAAPPRRGELAHKRFFSSPEWSTSTPDKRLIMFPRHVPQQASAAVPGRRVC